MSKQFVNILYLPRMRRLVKTENTKLTRSTMENKQIWQLESESLKAKNFDLENELKNLQFELLGKEELLRNSVKVEDVQTVKLENDAFSKTVILIIIKISG